MTLGILPHQVRASFIVFFGVAPNRTKSTLPGIYRILPGVSLISYCIPRMLVLLFLIIFEVKDWALDQIISVDPQFFTLSIEGQVVPQKNPLRQIREYFSKVLDKIKSDGHLVAKDAHSYGQVTVNSGVVFPNINKHEYEKKGLHQTILSERIFFWDDLHLQSPICEDPTGRCFQDALERLIVVTPRYPLTGRELNHLRQLIFPVARIDLPDRDAQKKRAETTRRLKLLDHNQESIARQYDGGHRIITGPSGNREAVLVFVRK
jgi:hypothetical protein